MKITRFILSALFGCCLVLSAVACSDLSGDNSDFDFGDMTSDEPENPYDGQGYDRLPNSVRLATYNTHRCEGWTQNAGTDRANYNNTAKVISLMDPDVIALQELDKNTTWHPTDQLQELADRTGILQDDRLPRRRLRYRHSLQDGAQDHLCRRSAGNRGAEVLPRGVRRLYLHRHALLP